MPAEAPGGAPLRVLHADDHLLVLHKPAGLLCVPGRGPDKQDCLSTRARAAWPDAEVVHRLDQATSGLVLMARGKAAQLALNRAFAEGEVHKRYLALVEGRLQAQGTDAAGWQLIELPIAADWPRRPLRIIDAGKGKPSQTRWRALAHEDGRTRVELEPLTGRTHQLRVHLQAIGHPIVGDALYGRPDAPRLMLQATGLRLRHPARDERLEFVGEPEF